ncbi:hypothetical protein ACXZ65_31040 [Streptomyces aculeolatus]
MPLLPRASQLTVNCTCPPAGRCTHTAALAYAPAHTRDPAISYRAALRARL